MLDFHACADEICKWLNGRSSVFGLRSSVYMLAPPTRNSIEDKGGTVHLFRGNETIAPRCCHLIESSALDEFKFHKCTVSVPQ